MIYQIPVYERYTQFGSFFLKRKCLKVDAIGLFVYYSRAEEIADPTIIRGRLIFRRKSQCLIEARNLQDAIERFYDEIEGTSMDVFVPQENALWLDTDGIIQELPNCKRLHKSERDQYICGRLLEDGDGNGEYSMCVLEGYDYPDDCPMQEFREQFYFRKKVGLLPIQQIGPYRLVRAEDIT